MLGLVLGSGAARGWAHVGVLQALRERGIRPDLVVGTSIGSIVGAIHAENRLDEVLAFVGTHDFTRSAKIFFEFKIHLDGLISGVHVMEFLSRFLSVEKISDLPIPYAAVATDLDNGRPVTIDSGKLSDAIRASISIPGLFTPVRRNGRVLVDGGLSCPVPVSVARDMGATRVIAVNVATWRPCPYFHRQAGADYSKRMWNHLRETLPAFNSLFTGRKSGQSLADVFLKTVRIAENRIAEEEIRRHPPDLLIEPAVGDIAAMDFARARDGIRAGYEAAAEALDRGD